MPRVWCAFRPFFIVLACLWVALGASDFVYARQFPRSPWITFALLPALAAETACYLASVLLETRKWFASFRPAIVRPAILWFTSLIPYLIFSLNAQTFHSNSFYLLVGLTAVFSFWHAIFPRRTAFDAGFLALAAAPFVMHVFAGIYISPDKRVPAEILGQLMWIRVGLVALLVLRQWEPGPIGLWPNLREWRSGAFFYALALAPVIMVALGVHGSRWSPMPVEQWWKGVAIFFGFLWVTALAEELFFRGVITRALLNRWPSKALAVLVSAVVYGSAHLWFRGFPNWRWAIVTTVLGLFCGWAYMRTGSVRVGMVTHALVVTTWRMFFK